MIVLKLVTLYLWKLTCSLRNLKAAASKKHITHVEGGWPKDINAADMEATSRFRKKTEKVSSKLSEKIREKTAEPPHAQESATTSANT